MKSAVITFWGTRGSIPAPGRSTVRCGGNTSCVEVRYGKASLILDGGTGIRVLGLRSAVRRHSPITILTSHVHLDHIFGIPFFGPALQNGQSLRIYGPAGIKRALQNLFPFPELASRKEIRELGVRTFQIGPFRISTQWLNHPAKTLAYRIRFPNRKVMVYASDHEPTPLFRHSKQAPSDASLIRWMGSPDLLIMDAQYSDEEYPRRRGWGHSPWSATMTTALLAGGRRLGPYHH